MRILGARGLACAIALSIVIPAIALGQSKVERQVEAKLKAAMESYDLLEYEDAKKGLLSALLLAKRKGFGKKAVAAKVHLHLGIVYFSGFQDKEGARLEFANAVEIDGKVQLPKAYKTKEMAAMLVGIKKDFAGDGSTEPATEPEGDELDCDNVEELEHELVESAPAGTKPIIAIKIGPDVEPAKVALYYRPDGAVKFQQTTMGRDGICGYSGTIPKSAVKGDVVHYYVSALDAKGKVIASSGSKGSPNIMEVTAAIAVSDGGDDPLGGGGEVETKAETGSSSGKKLFIAVAVGSGGGYVTGTTEATAVDVECCLAPALLHLMPEVGYWVSPSTSVSAAFRMGFPIGANVPGHATAAPSGFLRVRHALGEDGTGFALSGSIGGGIIRHTVKISNAAPGEDTDTTATGPLFLGAGLGYVKALSGPLRLVAELHGLVGLPVVDELGCPGNGCVKPNFGAQVDANLGLLFAF